MKEKEKIRYNVNEIFYSIQGEGSRIGLPCVFIRFQGCELRCSWCDTKYALEIDQEANMMGLQDILESVSRYDCRLVNLTGGEPLLQKELNLLIEKLIASGFEVLIETNGHQDISDIHKGAIIIMDLKAPGSAMSHHNRYSNISHLKKKDEIKIVVKNEEDYKWAKEILHKFVLNNIVNSVILSPVFGEISTESLAEWVLRDNLPVRIQVQLHKIIWGPERSGV